MSQGARWKEYQRENESKKLHHGERQHSIALCAKCKKGFTCRADENDGHGWCEACIVERRLKGAGDE